MISNVPSENMFYSSGNECFNLAWSIIHKLISSLNLAEEWNGIESDQKTKYWQAARREILTALLLVQQGVELILKGKIAAVSPFLLISKFDEKAKSSGCDFSDFFTIQENVLVKTCNCVSATPLSDFFNQEYEKMRRIRNEAMHGNASDYITSEQLLSLVKNVIKYLLFVNKNLYPNKRWLDMRLEYLENSPDNIIYDEPNEKLSLCYEVKDFIDFLDADIVKEYFLVSKNRTPYYCPFCYNQCSNRDDQFDEVKLAYPTTKRPYRQLYCPVCNRTFDIRKGKKHCCEEVLVYKNFCVNCMDEN